MATTSASDQAFKFPILIGDIGGTNARFAILVDAFAEPKAFPTVQTADYPTIEEAIQAAVLDKTSLQPKAAVLAVAGPIDGEAIELTNCPWVVRPREMIKSLDLGEIIVLNDFEAQALAVSALPDTGRRKVGGGLPHEGASRVVVGPGTGLGVAGLVRARRMWIPVAGEGGHVDLGPRTARDYALWPHLKTIENRVSAEEVLSGRGMVNLYDALCKVDGAEPVHRDAAAISGAAIAKSDALAVETVDLFCTYLGRVAGDLALIFMARGGVYIGGGIIQHLLPVLDPVRFREAFEDKAPHRHLLAEMAVYLVTEPLAALSGLATFARTPRFFGIETAGRRWVA